MSFINPALLKITTLSNAINCMCTLAYPVTAAAMNNCLHINATNQIDKQETTLDTSAELLLDKQVIARRSQHETSCKGAL